MQKTGSKFCLGGNLTELITLRRQKYDQTHENYLTGLMHLNSAVNVEKNWSWKDCMGCFRGQGKTMNLKRAIRKLRERNICTLWREVVCGSQTTEVIQ